MKKGFTLIELLAVIVVLGALAAISFPLVTNQINKSKENSYKTQIDTIINASNRWAFDNDSELPYDDSSSITISIDRIQKDGYLASGDIIDPRTEAKITGCIKITYDVNYKQHNYEYTEDCDTIDVE